MLRYVIGITFITAVIIIIRALTNGKVLKKYQYAMWLLIPEPSAWKMEKLRSKSFWSLLK